MESEREEASKARRIALKKLANKDFFGARRVALQAQRLCPELENLSQLLTVCEVFCAAEAKINGVLDLYAILQVEVKADDTVIRKQYDRLAFWLHCDSNPLPGVEVAFNLVSEVYTVLCDQVKRSLYDIKRQHASREVARNATRVSNKTCANKSGVTGCTTPYDFTMVFWTICPHCEKRFVYYQRNLLVSCDSCHRNFFAFNLHEQAVPSRFLSAAPNNSPVPPEILSCQQHSILSQHVHNMKLHSTRGHMDSESMVHALQTDEHINWHGMSGVDGEGSSAETRSNIVQFSPVNQTHSPSVDKDTIGGMLPDPQEPNFVGTQNLSGEDGSTVLNAAGPCSLKRLGKREHDDSAYSSNSRTFCKRQRNHDSLSDTISTDDKIVRGNVVGTDKKYVEHLFSKVDSQEYGNATNKGYGQVDKNETTDIGNQMSENPIIIYECPDFFDFGKFRDINSIAVDQIWAIYDEHDFMPRLYGQINHVDASSLRVKLTWLEHNTTNEQDAKWIREDIPVACGNFCLGETYELEDPSMCISHKISWSKGKIGNSFEIHPKKGEVWALYKRWSSDAESHQSYNCDVVEVSNDSTRIGVIVSPLVRIEGFVSLFAKDKDKCQILIPSSELFRFSHNIPCYRTNGNEMVGVAKGFLELDTAALPHDLASVFPSITMDSYMDINKKSVTQCVGTYPDSEFHNFDEDRSCEKFKRGQIWALYSDTDTFPNFYGWVSKVETEPFKVHLAWLKACPVEKIWLEIPMACGKFEILDSKSHLYEACVFSHLVETNPVGTDRQVKILPEVGEIWVIREKWSPCWVPSHNDRRAEYAIGKIIKSTEAGMVFAFLKKIEGHVSVFKPDIQKGVLRIPMEENLRFSHRIPSFRLTSENGGKLCGYDELDPAAVPDVFL